jgi:hypothetical protein
MTETEARQVLLLQASETGAAENPLWTLEDRTWATRLAVQTAGAQATPERFIVERARHAMQRLLPRDAAARRWVESRPLRPLWVVLALMLAFIAGAAADQIGASQHVNLLAPPVWAVVAWNLVVYLALLLPWRVGGLRSLLVRRWFARPGQIDAGRAELRAAWASHAAPLLGARAGALLHAAAAALALGLVAGLYVRGLVLDYRAGWQSTFLDAATVQMLLGTLLAPASTITGIVLPDVAPLRVAADVPATASAAPWIHLYAATLAAFVIVPRFVLGVAATWRARWLAARFPLPLQGPYFERLRLQQQGGRALVQVLPYAAGVGPQAGLGLRAALATVFGNDLQLRMGPLTAFGDEAAAAAITTEPGATLRVALFDLGATPEAEAQGRFVATLAGLQPALPLLLVADESAFRRRFGNLPDRLAERRAAWQRLADAHGAGLLCADLEAPELDAAERSLKIALR